MGQSGAVVAGAGRHGIRQKASRSGADSASPEKGNGAGTKHATRVAGAGTANEDQWHDGTTQKPSARNEGIKEREKKKMTSGENTRKTTGAESARKRREGRLKKGRVERGRRRITSRKKWTSIERRWWEKDRSKKEGGRMTSRRWTKGSKEERERGSGRGKGKGAQVPKSKRRSRRKAEDQGRAVAQNCLQAMRNHPERAAKKWVVRREGRGKSRQNRRWTLTKGKVKRVRRSDVTKQAHGAVWGKKARRI